MKILVINSGSSSIKFQLFQMPQEEVLASGLVEKIGLENSEIHFKSQIDQVDLELPIASHEIGLKQIVTLLLDDQIGVIKNVNEIALVGHRVVHGGKDFTSTIEINQEVKDKIKSLFSLAPLHNPHNLTGINVAEKVFSHAKQIAVFDTSFHKTMPEKAYTYAMPLEYRDKYGIRVYGFHGISHQFVSQRALAYLENAKAKIIVIHLGNGCSMTAIKDGKSIDHSLGFGPNEGLVMGTRSGQMDQGVIYYLMEKCEMSSQEVNDLLTKKSGMLGLTGDSDLRAIEANAAQGDEDANLALEINAYRIKKYIGAYAAILNGLNAIVFTAGIGENSDVIRAKVCEDMNFLGIELDSEKNAIRSKDARDISASNSEVNVLVIPTNEELQIAQECHQMVL